MPNIHFSGLVESSTFRRMASVAWDHPGDPSIFGFLDFDAAPLERRLQALRDEGKRITVTHMVAKAVALVLKKHPDLNVVLRRKQLYYRRDVDVFLQVAIQDDGELGQADLSGVKIPSCDEKSLEEIADFCKTRVAQVKERQDPELQRSKVTIAKLPRFMLKPVVRFFSWCQREPNWRMGWAGMPRDPFGSAMITSLGMLGIETAFAPLFPLGGPPLVILVGAIKDQPYCEPDGSVRARRTLRLCGTFDHRILDGVHLATFSDALKELLEVEIDSL